MGLFKPVVFFKQKLVAAAFTSGILDTYTGAVAGYSLRRLTITYTGPAIEVTRTSDSATQDIGFDSNGDLDTSALTTFIGANTGVVSKWYDQSGNGQTMSQTTAANRPTIISSGTLITQGGKPAIRFDGSNDSFIAPINNPFTFTGAVSFVSAIYKNSTAFKQYETIISAGTGGSSAINGDKSMAFGFPNDSRFNPTVRLGTDIWRPSGAMGNTTVTTNARHLTGIYINNWSTHRSTGTTMRLDSTAQSVSAYNTINPASLNSNAMKLGVFDTILASSFFAGDIQEVLLWASNKSSDSVGIETNVNDYYSIY